MYYNNLSGCNEILKEVKPIEINTWEINNCDKCVVVKGTSGSFSTRTQCNGALSILNKYCKSCGHCNERYDCMVSRYGYNCSDGCREYVCKGTYTTKAECLNACKPWKCNLGKGCTLINGKADYAYEDECNNGCQGYTCHKGKGCSLDPSSTSHLSECKASCLFWGCNNGLCTTSISGIYDNKAECVKACVSYECGANGCRQISGDKGQYKTLSDCKAGCKPWNCDTKQGCIHADGHKGDYKTKADCISNCGFTCNTHIGCSHAKGGQYKGLEDCVTNCPNYECHTGTCEKTPYGQYGSKAQCVKSCSTPEKHIKYPTRANGVWFIGDNYSFKGFQGSIDSKYGWLKNDKINVISLSFANPYSILTKGQHDSDADEDGLPLGMKGVINYLNADNKGSNGEQKRVVMISVGGWNNSVCSTKSCENSGNCYKSPCITCACKGGCNCDTAFSRGPCKAVSGYCSGDACCGITSFAGPWPAIPKGVKAYQELISKGKPSHPEQNSYNEFGGVKICDLAVDGCKSGDCNDNWYRAFVENKGPYNGNGSSMLGTRFGEIAKKYGVGIEIDYEPQCGWGQCVYCNNSGDFPCSKESDNGVSYQCENSNSTVPFMQNVVNAYNTEIGGQFKGSIDYQPGPNNPLTIDCGGGAWWLTDIFEFAQDNIHGRNYNSIGDPSSNKMTIANIMVDSLPLGSMNSAISCSPDMIDNCVANRACDYAALAAAWLWAPHFIPKGSKMKTLNNIKSCHGYTVNDLSDLEGKKVLYADNPIYEGFYDTPGVPPNFKLLNSERTSISLFCGNGPSLKASWDGVYDKLGCGNDPTKVPPTIEVLFNLLSHKIDTAGNKIFYPGSGDLENKYHSKGKIGGIMYWGAGLNGEKMLGASNIKSGGSDICQTFKASYEVLNGSKAYDCNEACNSCTTTHTKSCALTPSEIGKYWNKYKGGQMKGVEIITYACGTSTCGSWALKGSESDLELLNGCSQIIVPWVTSINQEGKGVLANTCYKSSDKASYPTKMNELLKAQSNCIEKWGGKKILSLGGWAEGYTFSQDYMKINDPDGYIPNAEGPIKRVIPCFNSKAAICQDHPSTKILPPGNNWGYWCFTKNNINIAMKGGVQGGVGCDGGTGDIPPEDCWNWFAENKGSLLQNKFIDYAVSNNYWGVDVDYEPNGSVGNQPFNSWYVYKTSKLANAKNLYLTMAPLQNFFIDNRYWDVVQYSGSEYETYKTTSSKGYYCEKAGGYGNMLFELYKNGIDMYSIFIQFYNNPPTVCDATVGNSDYCVTCGTLGTVVNYGPDATILNKDDPDGEGGKYYTTGPACGGGVVTRGEVTDFKVLQCNYSEDKGNWAWQKAGYEYTGGVNNNLTGSFCGDPVGNYIKDDNPWLTTSRVDDEPWLVSSKGGKDENVPMQLGGIKNTVMVMLLAKCYQPNSIIAYGTVPPEGGNCANLSSTMVLDIFKHIYNLENEIKNDICNNSKSPLLCFLMTELYDGGRLRMPRMNSDYWNTNWGGSPHTAGFCTKYPGYDKNKYLFGGLGAWSTYWTEVKESGTGTAKSWIENIKDEFDITKADISKCYKGSSPSPPPSPPPSPTHPTKGTYKVKSGDICFNIAEKLCGNGQKYNEVICNNACSNLQANTTITYDCNGCKGQTPVTNVNWCVKDSASGAPDNFPKGCGLQCPNGTEVECTNQSSVYTECINSNGLACPNP